MKLIIGLGNPEQKYAKTRHNTGYMTVTWLAAKHNASWQTKTKLQIEQAQIEINGTPLLLVRPTVNYNNNGASVQKVKAFYNLENHDILVIHDDLALPFGTLRVRQKGSDAGNNGIKSVNAHIGEDYARIRVGIGDETRHQSDMDFVLSHFSQDETAKLPDIFTLTENIIHTFTTDKLEPTSYNLFPL